MDLNRIKLIIKLGRFQFLFFGFLCFTTGTLLAVILNNQFSWDRFILGYAVLLPAHLSVSYSNDYWDFMVDHYNLPTRFTGGSGVLVENPELKPFARRFAILLILISISIALIFTYIYSSLAFLLIALLGNFMAWYYSAPPLKFAYRGLGEISTALSGLIIPSLGYVAITGFLDLKILLFSVPFMIYMGFFILSVEIPDLEGDKKGGKNTFIVKYGRKMGFAIIFLAGIVGTTSFLLLSFTGLYNNINFQILMLLSFLPLFTGVYAFTKRTSFMDKATKLVNYTVPSLVIFIILIDLYFLTIIFNI
ncbi:prenyltransferase [Methanobacterium formicicum]|uniref:UbiA prenyltransferase n=1 Tax=Methanobacterium formicicum (strain DSM 3637 / PP1) TaxID=1204725 RepID=K2RTE3_METFP|nr:prenyltransferase [Methanobacterium formicicum]EKF86060.1 UbiA prenyltransferase [Methanobacterium formicicum DSM 3637]